MLPVESPNTSRLDPVSPTPGNAGKAALHTMVDAHLQSWIKQEKVLGKSAF